MADLPGRDEWAKRAEGLDPRRQAYIDGTFVDAVSGETFSCISPITGRALADVAACDAEDVDRAVRASRAAFEDRRWAGRSPQDRRRTLLRWVDLLYEHLEELALLETLDAGKPIADTLQGDIPIAAEDLRYFAEAVDKLYGEVAPTDPSVVAMITREPVGVVGAVVPWNFPLSMAMWKVAPALATGNSVVLKPAEQSPLSALRAAELASEAGIPDGVLNVLPGFGETAGQALGRHIDVDAIAFTGSTEVGKKFLTYAGESNMKIVSLECGGKNPQVVLPDCPDLDVAATKIARGSFFNQGQVCNAASRLLVHDDIREDFAQLVLAAAQAWQPSDPLDPATTTGALVDETQMRRVLDYIEIGQSEGANLRIGGNRVLEDTGGFYIEPTVFDGVDSGMRISREEIFGPVLSVSGFSDPDEAVRMANDTEYGLAATVWTRNIDTAFQLARGIRAGVVCVNTYAFGWSMVPFGGFKQSGYGRDQSIHAMEKYTQLKTTWIDVG